jgi:hypothetical protein
MMNDMPHDEAVESALYAYKVYQGLLKNASDRKDVSSFREAFTGFFSLFDMYIEKPEGQSVEIIEMQLAHVDDENERISLRSQLEKQRTYRDTRARLKRARSQVVFALAARLLDQFLKQPGDTDMNELFNIAMAQLPANLKDLTLLLASLESDPATDWGWDWWDLPADGKVHSIDTHSKPNQLYGVAALRLLAGMSKDALTSLHLPHSHTLAFLADPKNEQGLVATLNSMKANSKKWPDVLSRKQIAMIPVLLELLGKARLDHERAEEDQIIAAPLDPEKVASFKTNVVDAVRRFGRLRSVFEKYGALSIQSEQVGETIPSWGYNQIDEKGAYVSDTHTSYVGWGEAYGRGLGQTEDHRAFTTMIEGADEKVSAKQKNLLRMIEERVMTSKFDSPIILQSVGTLGLSQLYSNDVFIPQFHKDCPHTGLTGLDGFRGVFKFKDITLPILDVFVRGEDVKGRVVICDLANFVRWDQYPPIDEVDEDRHVVDFVFIRVRDLNSDDELRNKILSETPSWLKDIEDKERYLRSRVTVNIFEKLKIEILNKKYAISISVSENGTPLPQN